jgi:hypothetical protein
VITKSFPQAATVRLVVEGSAFTNNRGGALCVDDQRRARPSLARGESAIERQS